MSNKYTGFWNPKRNYAVDDIVTYYSASGYSTTKYYKCTSPVSSVRNNLGYTGCPLANFQQPVVSGGLTPYIVDPAEWNPTEGHKLIEISAELMSNTTDWTEYQYYHPTFWVGPNGNQLQIQTSFWIVEDLTSNQSNIDNAPVSSQNFSSTSRTTATGGLYNASGTEEITFDNISDSPEGGELEADNYYISSVQNYKGYWNKAGDYKKFDIIRHRESNAFYYAKKDINNFINSEWPNAVGDTRGFGSLDMFPPDIPLVENHVGTVVYRGPTGFIYDNQGGLLNNRMIEGQTVRIDLGGNVILGTYSIAKVTNDVMILASYCASGQDYHQITEEDFLPTFLSKGMNFKVLTLDEDAGDPFLDNNYQNDWTKDHFIFDPDYGSSVEFKSELVEYNYGDGYNSYRPNGPNGLRATFKLKFSNRTNREANAILHFIENHLGQHEPGPEKKFQLDYNQGIDGFYMDGLSLFFPYLNTENLTRKFNCFEFDHEIETEDTHTINLSIFDNSSSILNRNDYMYLNRPDIYQADVMYKKNDVVYIEENNAYYYHIGDTTSLGDPPIVEDSDGNITSINHNIWTREFHWFASTPFNVSHKPDIVEFGGKNSSYTQYFPAHKVNQNLLEFSLTFSNRRAEEAYAILHFLESRLGCKSFLYTPPAPYNRKRRFICKEWKHTYEFQNSHTITAKFEQFALGQNTPLDDDEIDDIGKDSSPEEDAKLVANQEINLESSYKPGASQKFYIRNIIEIENIGEKKAEEISVEIIGDDSSKFSKSNLGTYAQTYQGKTMLSSPEGHNNGESGVFLYRENNTIKAQDNLGRKSVVGSSVLSSRTSGAPHLSSGFITQQTELDAGGKLFIEVITEVDENDNPKEGNDVYDAKLRFKYKSEGESIDLYSNFNINARIAYESSKEHTIDISVEGEALGDVYKKEYSADLYSEVNTVDPNDKFLNFKASAMVEGGYLAEPKTMEEFNNILLSNGAPGLILIGIKYDSSSTPAWTYATSGENATSFVSSLGIFVAANNDINNNLIPINDGDMLALRTKSSPREIQSIESISNEDGALIDAIIIEKLKFNSLHNIDLKDILIRETNKNGQSLSNIKNINFNMSGVISSENIELPAIKTGSGYIKGQVVNVNFAEGCYVIGKGGRGGNGMFSEGKIDENDGSKTSIPYITPPGSGEDGGVAFEVNESSPLVQFKINLPTQGGIFGGGGGGAGGNVDKAMDFEWPVSLSSNIDFGGGGGGGAGMGVPGNILAKAGKINSGGSGGIQKTHSFLYTMQNGGDGGNLGEEGAGNTQSKMFEINGGKAGPGIVYYISTNIEFTGNNSNNLKGNPAKTT